MSLASFQSNLDTEFGAVSELWSPRVVAIANRQLPRKRIPSSLLLGIRASPDS